MSPIIGSFASGGSFGGRGGLPPVNFLYDFTSATFSGVGSVQTGPTLAQARSGVSAPAGTGWVNDTAFFNTSGGIQYWTVPANGIYRINALGARGGTGNNTAGYGTRMQGDFFLNEGEIIRIALGQIGQSGGHSQGGSVGAGGGGTYVIRTPYNTNGSILVIAGGGGGGASNPWTNAAGKNASTGNDGTQGGSTSYAGGTNGQGGAGPTHSGSGAGFFGDGNNGSGTPAGQNAKSFVNGCAGGRNARSWGGPELYGGFGGGGGGGGLAGGGGGGYGGGAGGTWSSQQAGGGGGSYNSGTNQSNTAGQGTGNGNVTITYLES